jgi:GTP-binding protein
VADYPFTTLYPNLGVVSVEVDRSFVIADIPGIIEGAAEGAGLGSLFLRHVQRTRVLLHLVDMAPFDDSIDPVYQVRAIEDELRRYDPGMLAKPRWLVMNKGDLLDPDERDRRAEAIVKGLDWKEPWFVVSAIGREGTWPVVLRIQQFFDDRKREIAEAAEDASERARMQTDG